MLLAIAHRLTRNWVRSDTQVYYINTHKELTLSDSVSRARIEDFGQALRDQKACLEIKMHVILVALRSKARRTRHAKKGLGKAPILNV